MIRIMVAKVYDDTLITDQEAAEMTDADIIELAMEDLGYFVDGATWTIERRITNGET